MEVAQDFRALIAEKNIDYLLKQKKHVYLATLNAAGWSGEEWLRIKCNLSTREDIKKKNRRRKMGHKRRAPKGITRSK